jgi:hypothetical protein
MHGSLNATKSFILTKAPLPVELGVLNAADVAQWDTATPTTLIVTPVANTYTANSVIPDTAALVRLDFRLQVTIGAATATCIEFRQLFAISAQGALLPNSYSFENIVYNPSTSGPVRATGVFPPRRVFLGTCPLLSVTPGRVEINCEFADVTELWWANWAAKDEWGWYLDPDLGGRQELLRVMAWTSGTAPMLWFAAISPQSLTGNASPPQPSSRQGAEIIFFRAPAGFNSFRYSSDEKGFLDSNHGDRTMFHLARWMLSPLSWTQIEAKLKKRGSNPLPKEVELMSLRIKPDSPPPAILPKDPIDSIQKNFRRAFRPVCVEAALSRSPALDVALLPLGFDGGRDPPIPDGYTALLHRDALRDTVNSARALLWTRSAVGTSLTSTPSFDRQIWLAGNSGANDAMFRCLSANAADIDRVISFDATDGFPGQQLLPGTGVRAVAAAAKIRAKLGKTLRAVFVTTPHMWKTKDEYQKIETKLVATKADVVMLPPDSEWDTYWTYPPTSTSNPLLFEVLRAWDGNGLAASKRFGVMVPPPPAGRVQWLFWHEWSVDGGHLVTVPGGAAGAPPTIQVKTFFEDVLNG